MKKPFLLACIIGMILVLWSVLLMLVFPGKGYSLPDGFKTPILSFEFARTGDDIKGIFGPEDTLERKAMIRDMDLGNRVDFGYMLLYGSFLAAFSLACARMTGRRRYLLLALLPIAAAIADACENIQLFGITAKIVSGGFEKELYFLHIFTWMKWGALSLFFLLMGPFFWKEGISGKIISALSIISFALGSAVFLKRSFLNELYVITLMLLFFGVLGYVCVNRKHEVVAGV